MMKKENLPYYILMHQQGIVHLDRRHHSCPNAIYRVPAVFRIDKYKRFITKN